MRWGRRRHHCAPGYARARIFMCAVAETVWPKRLIWRCDFIWVNAASINYSRNSATAEMCINPKRLTTKDDDYVSRNTFCRWTAFHRSEEHTSELQSRGQLVCRLLLAKH